MAGRDSENRMLKFRAYHRNKEELIRKRREERQNEIDKLEKERKTRGYNAAPDRRGYNAAEKARIRSILNEFADTRYFDPIDRELFFKEAELGKFGSSYGDILDKLKLLDEDEERFEEEIRRDKESTPTQVEYSEMEQERLEAEQAQLKAEQAQRKVEEEKQEKEEKERAALFKGAIPMVPREAQSTVDMQKYREQREREEIMASLEAMQGPLRDLGDKRTDSYEVEFYNSHLSNLLTYNNFNEENPGLRTLDDLRKTFNFYQKIINDAQGQGGGSKKKKSRKTKRKGKKSKRKGSKRRGSKRKSSKSRKTRTC